jgi:hypothetical protein
MMRNIMYAAAPQQCTSKGGCSQQIQYNKIKTSTNDPTVTRKATIAHNARFSKR